MNVIGIDVGGTSLRAALVECGGRIVARRTAPTAPERGALATIGALVALVHEVVTLAGDTEAPSAIGLGITGPIDVASGVVSNPFTLGNWPPTDIRAPLADAFGLPTFVDNDANVAALGEWWRGAGIGAHRLAMVTIGTGIGVGLLVDGLVQRAADGRHGEAGHQLLDPSGPPCYCGARGCWESLASGTALRCRAIDHAFAPGSLLHAMANGDPARVDGALVAAAAKAGDERAAEVLDEVARWLGLGLVNLAAIFMPDTIVLSGGVADNFDRMQQTMLDVMRGHSIMVPTDVTLAPAAAGVEAGIVGAARLALDGVGREPRASRSPVR